MSVVADEMRSVRFIALVGLITDEAIGATDTEGDNVAGSPVILFSATRHVACPLTKPQVVPRGQHSCL